MNITYTWAITGMKMAPSLDGLTDVVTNVQFKYTGTDSISGFSADFMGAIPVGTPDPSDFVPLADLTEDEVIAWVQSIYPMDHPNDVVEKGIENQITPTNTQAPMPWAPPEPTPIPPPE
tara:strand:+ start:4390 stop:4746 length:357 start_codon:yes stop_codon:yes gene_type:complete